MGPVAGPFGSGCRRSGLNEKTEGHHWPHDDPQAAVSFEICDYWYLGVSGIILGSSLWPMGLSFRCCCSRRHVLISVWGLANLSHGAPDGHM